MDGDVDVLSGRQKLLGKIALEGAGSKQEQSDMVFESTLRPGLAGLETGEGQASDHGWDWSGGFAPDQLGDTQVKVRNHSSGAMQMLRVEVSTMTSSSRSTNKDVGSGGESLGTCLILLSDDETGFMPYRIDNFSMEVDLFFWFSIFFRACHLCLPS